MTVRNSVERNAVAWRARSRNIWKTRRRAARRRADAELTRQACGKSFQWNAERRRVRNCTVTTLADGDGKAFDSMSWKDGMEQHFGNIFNDCPVGGAHGVRRDAASRIRGAEVEFNMANNIVDLKGFSLPDVSDAVGLVVSQPTVGACLSRFDRFLGIYTDGSGVDCRNATVGDCKKQKLMPDSSTGGYGFVVMRKTLTDGRDIFDPVVYDCDETLFAGSGTVDMLYSAGDRGPELLERDDSNGIAEIAAIHAALLHVLTRNYGLPVMIYYDSTYAAAVTSMRCGATHNVRAACAAQELLKTVLERVPVDFCHVYGHSGNAGNCRADELAGDAAAGKGSVSLDYGCCGCGADEMGVVADGLYVAPDDGADFHGGGRSVGKAHVDLGWLVDVMGTGPPAKMASATYRNPIAFEKYAGAVARIRGRRAVGGDGLVGEVVREMGIRWHVYLWQILGMIACGFAYPESWTQSIAILIQKGTAAPTEFSSFWQIVLDSVCAKLYMSILTDIVKPFVSSFRFELKQFAARPGMQAVDLIHICRVCIELARDWQDTTVFVAKLDLRKAFDTLRHGPILDALFAVGVPANWICAVLKHVVNGSFVCMPGRHHERPHRNGKRHSTRQAGVDAHLLYHVGLRLAGPAFILEIKRHGHPHLP